MLKAEIGIFLYQQAVNKFDLVVGFKADSCLNTEARGGIGELGRDSVVVRNLKSCLRNTGLGESLDGMAEYCGI